jgi:hypothetical protein
MPIFGLPKIIENTINGILDSSNVSSRNIREGEGTLQISIRFNMEAIDIVGPDTRNVTYRKVPPSQAKRDTNRAMAWSTCKNANRDKDTDEQTRNVFTPGDTFQDGEPTTEGAFKDRIHHEAVLTSIPSPLPAQVDGTTDSPGSVQSSPADFNQSGPSHIDQASEVASLEHKQYDTKESNTDSNIWSTSGDTIALDNVVHVIPQLSLRTVYNVASGANLCSVYHV